MSLTPLTRILNPSMQPISLRAQLTESSPCLGLLPDVRGEHRLSEAGPAARGPAPAHLSSPEGHSSPSKGNEQPALSSSWLWAVQPGWVGGLRANFLVSNDTILEQCSIPRIQLWPCAWGVVSVWALGGALPPGACAFSGAR